MTAREPRPIDVEVVRQNDRWLIRPPSALPRGRPPFSILPGAEGVNAALRRFSRVYGAPVNVVRDDRKISSAGMMHAIADYERLLHELAHVLGTDAGQLESDLFTLWETDERVPPMNERVDQLRQMLQDRKA